jgi:hypothetical protein
MANWWDGEESPKEYNSFQRMNYALTETRLIAAWSMKLNIAWGRFVVAMVILGCMVIAAAWLEQKEGSNKKKK